MSQQYETIPQSDYSPELSQLLVRAELIHQTYDPSFSASFTALLVAFLASHDPLSEWFQGYVQEANIAVDAILEELKLSRERLADIASQSVSQDATQTQGQSTSSAKSLLAAARIYRDEVSTSDDPIRPLDVRHLMAAYIYDPAGHDAQLSSWGFVRPAWSNAFLQYLLGRVSSSELAGWKGIHARKFPSAPLSLPEDAGPSAHIANDRATSDDILGYRAYAYAIYRFMTHEQTRAPLTISIQAPWGGGKTSLMYMIRDRLDPKWREKREQDDGPEMSLRRALGDIDKWGAMVPDLIDSLPFESEAKVGRLTVWFEPWKYESSNQVWAGLADAIMRQVAERLPQEQRALFWLRLNYRRVDASQIRMDLYQWVLGQVWQKWLPWLVGGLITLALAVVAIFVGRAQEALCARTFGWAGTILATMGSLLSFAIRFRQERRAVEKEPAEIKLTRYLDMPDYRSELGLVHHVEADLQRVFDSIPPQYRPIVVFIDDLDRCSPDTIAEVIEGINLFFAKGYGCMFVFGMDPEMVAAALETAHADVIERLPEDVTSPIGWRFMEKFVQLPFVIPPPTSRDVRRYTMMLFSHSAGPSSASVAGPPGPGHLPQVGAGELDVEAPLDRAIRDVQRAYQAEWDERQSTMDAQIDLYKDTNPEIRDVIIQAAAAFSRNPRELKRFVNVFRFQYFLWSAGAGQDPSDRITLDQLQRWVVLSMKWPEVVRWIRRGSGREPRPTADGEPSRIPSRLSQLENTAGCSAWPTGWLQACETLGLTSENAPWINDEDLYLFFHNEYSGHPPEDRLSGGEGKGLW